MATDQATYDYSTDPAFLQAKPEDQHAYLMENEPNYKGAKPEDQRAYLSHVNGGEYTGHGAIANPPVSPMPHVNMQETGAFGEQVTPLTREQSNRGNEGAGTGVMLGTGLVGAGTSIAERGLAGAAKAGGRGLLKAGAGAVAGGGVGAAVGAPFGKAKEGAEIGGTIGTMGAPFMSDTAFSRAPYGINRLILGEEGLADAQAASQVARQNARVRAGLQQHPSVPAHAEMEADIVKGQLTRAGAHGEMQADIAREAAKQPEAVVARRQAIEEASNNAINRKGWTARLSPRMPSKPAEVAGEPGDGAGLRRGGNEGRPATWNTEKLYQEANNGNREAIIQLNRRGVEPPPNSRYVIGSPDLERGVQHPATTSELEPGNVPIRQGGRIRLGPPASTPRNEYPEGGRPIGGGGPIVPTPPPAPGLKGGGMMERPPVEHEIPGGKVNAPFTDEEQAKIDELAQKFTAEGTDRNTAYQDAEHTVRAASGKGYYNSEERRMSQDRISRYSGPERRGQR